MIVEIGTSDFRTHAGKVDGLFIEPVKEYFDRLPDCLKENVAVSNKEGSIDIYYIPSDKIKELELPNWIRGCNSVGKPHKTLVKAGWDKYCTKDKVKVVRIKTLLDKHNITDIDLLKVDTEGHDTIILNDYLDTVDFLPRKIQFEANVLSDLVEVYKLVERLKGLGYMCSKVQEDYVCVR